jgi:hypothetical protein
VAKIREVLPSTLLSEAARYALACNTVRGSAATAAACSGGGGGAAPGAAARVEEVAAVVEQECNRALTAAEQKRALLPLLRLRQAACHPQVCAQLRVS